MARTENLTGCLTAAITPLKKDLSIDWDGSEKNLNFQLGNDVIGIVPVGTTGESPTLTSEEHNLVIAKTTIFVDGEMLVLAGCGSNSTQEALHYVEMADAVGCDGALLVDPYYIGPSSFEIRENYYWYIARQFPRLWFVPYIIPGRTGCALSAEDLAILARRRNSNVIAVKEATGDRGRMIKTRILTPKGFQILSGDDDKTFEMMVDKNIKASGVISVISNIAPGAVSDMCSCIRSGTITFLARAEEIRAALDPLFKVVTVTTEREERIRGKTVTIKDKFRNPLPIKTMMQGLGMPAGPCRPPLGKMTSQGVEVVRKALRDVWRDNPWVLEPIERSFPVDIEARLRDDTIWQKLAC